MGQQRIGGAVAAITGTHDRYISAVDIRKRREIARGFGEIMTFPFAQLPVDDLHKCAAIIGDSTVVDTYDDIAVLRQPLLEAVAGPPVGYVMRFRATVHLHDDRIAFRRV